MQSIRVLAARLLLRMERALMPVPAFVPVAVPGFAEPAPPGGRRRTASTLFAEAHTDGPWEAEGAPATGQARGEAERAEAEAELRRQISEWASEVAGRAAADPLAGPVAGPGAPPGTDSSADPGTDPSGFGR
ncbi:hypothetical protein DEJ49_31765 [Streptomyces venezuelae]|uniref:Uncharacterized protein n=1 Tax=Streptomyces venezuelae TaxID=54571 RepID=A0A5P2CPY9_STRVZ|nr:hypothetical protein [Streptomyces venezuelae]QES44964.1 hypothetical protein DEJ49_31765 [Streptomyces venezuelae]